MQVDDDGSDALLVAQAFRQANDLDTMETLNAFAASSTNKAKELVFYVVCAKWMERAWPILMSLAPETSSTWREEVGQIENAELLANVKSNGSSKNGGPVRLRRDVQHQRDFFLLGQNAWLVVKQKFGYDYDIPRRCITSDRYESKVAVQVHTPEECGIPFDIPIPPSGRFGYEKVLHVPANAATRSQVKGIAAAAALAANEKYLGNVSDDETAEIGDDLFPALDDDDRMSLDQPAKNHPVLLLPAPSHRWPLETPSNWMKNGTDSSDDDEDDDDINHKILGSVVRKPYGSGLGNLGNTCFMNSTLQCLAHTDPLRKYFLSGEYENDLNRENPLGTGGELAIQFAKLLGEMWGTAANEGYGMSGYGSNMGVVYPRSFKLSLGKHAAQFVGYDQHDSQELATYLLDALHEDTNRVTKKPYVEKPEQGENETDEEAASKAWNLHLQREDSTVLEYFMGLVKSRVQCCKDTCNRVSTTFDPFMYLSVPIPGSSNKLLRVTFFPLDPSMRPQEVEVSVNKSGSIADLLSKTVERLKDLQIIDTNEVIMTKDLLAVDIWQTDIYSWYKENDDVDLLKENDETFVYQLAALSEIQQIEEQNSASRSRMDFASQLNLRDRPTPKKFQLDLATKTRLNQGDAWVKEFLKYLSNETSFVNTFNARRGSSEERARTYGRLCMFIDQLYQDIENETEAGLKRDREGNAEPRAIVVSPDEDVVPAIIDRCNSSSMFRNVEKRFDMAVLEFIAGKMRTEIHNMEHRKIESFPEGVIIQIRIRKYSHHHHLISKELNMGTPFVMRVPSDLTVFGLRERLAKRLARIIKTAQDPISSGESTSERPTANLMGSASWNVDFGSPELIMRQIPLTYERRCLSAHGKSNTGTGSQLGTIEKEAYNTENGRLVALASPSDEQEKVSVAQVVGNGGSVYVEWPEKLADLYFDLPEYGTLDRPTKRGEHDGFRTGGLRKITVSVKDCIEKYCQMEQLEETEMWYCNRCEEHVRAWKQFHIYTSPPILIIHLKRFQFSATTHRRDKINIFIDFPLEGLDLTEHVMQSTDAEKPVYDCYAVSNHFGGLGGGHYTAHCLNDDGVWCHYDDSRVTTHVDPREVVSASAYVLYYRRRDVRVGEDFPMSLQTPVFEVPAIIQSDAGGKSDDISDDASGSNVAIVDEDGMDTDPPSRATSPMGSMDGNTDPFVDHDFDTALPDGNHGHLFPLQ